MKVLGLFRMKAAFAAIALLSGLFCSGAVLAQTATLSFVSEPGDYIGAGQTLSFSNPDISAMSSNDNAYVGISINNADHWFYLDLVAPQGQKLVPGVYNNAVRAPFQDASQPGLSFYGDGRGCNTLTGTFTVLEAVYGPFGYVQTFHATWEQHCEGGTPALFGEVSIHNPPPPPALTIDLKFDTQGTVRRVTGQAVVGGTVTCSVATNVSVTGGLVQRAGRFSLSNGTFDTTSACSPTPTRWTAIASTYTTPYNPGAAQINATVNGYDPNYHSPVTASGSAVVNLTGGGKTVKTKNK